MIGYLILTAIFVLMIAACFGFAVSELIRPRDPGPLPIDVSRDINHRYFASLIRREHGPAKDILPVHADSGEPVRSVRLNPGTTLEDSDFVTHIIGDGDVAPGARVVSIACDGVARIGEHATVRSHAEGVTELLISPGARVLGRATSPGRIVLAPTAEVFDAAAPIIRTSGLAVRAVPVPVAAWDPELDADLDWLLSNGEFADTALREIERSCARTLDSVQALLEYERQTLRPSSLIDLGDAMTPSWLANMKAWYLGAATIRVRGNAQLPENAFVPYHMIVEGDLLAQPGVRFGGGVHASGSVTLGDECRVFGSVVAGHHVVLGEDVTVDECVSAQFDVYAGSSVWVGGDRNGGLIAGGFAELGFGTVIRQRLYAEHGARVIALPTESEIEHLGLARSNAV